MGIVTGCDLSLQYGQVNFYMRKTKLSTKLMRCSAFCPVENYRLAAITSFFRGIGAIVKSYRKVLHIIPQNKQGDVFVFSYGCAVMWGMRNAEEQEMLKTLAQFSTGELPNIETARFAFRYGSRTEMASHGRFNVDIIMLDSDSMQLKLAFSYGLAQSIQLESYESSVQKTIEMNSHLPIQLAQKGAIHVSRNEISRRMGEIFLARSSINLNSEFLAAPEYFWEHPSLEDYYNMSEKFLDIPRRVKTLNQKLDVLHELFDMLNSQLQHKYTSILELVIIFLIFFEIVLSLLRH
jgi:uncharacterized Rmd1/YagE family protein